MKKNRRMFRAAVVLFAGIQIAGSCGENGFTGKGPVVFDLNGNYPEKELNYSELFDVQYVPVETDTIMLQSLELLHIGKGEWIGYESGSGKFLFLNPSGKIERFFSRKGNGPEEYNGVLLNPVYDPVSEEIYVYNGSTGKCLVYDKMGNCLRILHRPEEPGKLERIWNLDEESILAYFSLSSLRSEKSAGYYSVFSKRDGSEMRKMHLPEAVYKSPNGFVRVGNQIGIFKVLERPAIDAGESVLLTISACDTIYRLDRRSGTLAPVLYSVPPVAEQPENYTAFLYPLWETDGYLAVYKLTKDMRSSEIPKMDDAVYLYDKKEKAFFRLKERMDGYEAEQTWKFAESSLPYGTWAFSRTAAFLVRELEKDHLSGTVREIASGLDEEDNPVMEILTLKK